MKIFCLGFHKTGTLSLAHALKELGYKVRHGYKPQSDLIERALRDRKQPLEYVEDESQKRGVGEHDAYLDLYAVRWFYPVLDNTYPNSKFILTTRDTEEWLGSVHRQMRKRPNSPYFHYWYYQTDTQRRLDKINSEAEIRQYFENRDSYLEMQIMDNTSQENWRQLCQFLGKPTPGRPFPHANKSPVQ